jgi:RNA polymerase sigma-70 factor (ECF subfamily)
MNYNEVYEQYYKKITRYLAGIVGQSEAQDLAQEVFVKVGNKLGSLKDQSRISSWIFKIALNTARDSLRQRSINNSRCLSFPSQVENANDAIQQAADTHSRTPEELVVRNEMIQCYLDFVTKLPKHYYDVYVLSELEGLQDKTISRQLSIPLETVKIRLHRARARLYEELRTHCRCYYNDRGQLMGTRK